MKIAAITEDGKTISQHFGRAPYYMVLTVDDGLVVDRQLRDKLGHTHFQNEPHEGDQPGQPHGFGPVSHDRHLQMAEAIAGCEALLFRGMGAGAYYSIQQRGIRPIVTDIAEIDAAAKAYIDGTIEDRVDKLH